MHPDDLLYPALWFRERAYFLKRAERLSGSYFGGPFTGKILGAPKARLHHIATIQGQCFPPLHSRVGGGEINLLYGISHESCELAYRRARYGEIEVVKVNPPRPSKDWPYPDYPSHLPYLPMQLEQEVECSLKEFSELSCQPPFEAEPDEVIILVPPSPMLGMSMWGPDGDLECVQIVFRYNYVTEVVKGKAQSG